MQHQHRANGSAPVDRREWLALGLALLMALLVALPVVLGPGIVNTRGGGDAPFLVQRTHQLAEGLRAGALPVRWMPNAALGLGYPAFNYYAALPYYVSALASLAGLGVLGGIKFAQLLGYLLAGGASYGLARALGLRRPGALLASLAYTLAPFHLVNSVVRGDALSEFYAMALAPLALWALLRLVRAPGPGSLLALGVAYGLLAVCHNISAMLVSPVLALWLLALGLAQPRERRARALGTGVAALLLGLALSAWFWLPALTEQGLVQLGDQTTGYFHYPGHFRGLDLVQRCLIFDYGIGDGRDPFRMGLVQAVLTVVALLTTLLTAPARRSRLVDGLLAACWLASTLLITSLSRVVWDHVPLLAFTQFPWRLLAPQALFGALLVGRLLDAMVGWLGQRRGWAPGLLLGALWSVAACAGLSIDRLALTEADVTPQRMMLYEAYSGNLGGTVRYEFLPASMVPRPQASEALITGVLPGQPRALSGRLAQAALLQADARRQIWSVTLEEAGWIAFQLAAWPGWEGMLDGQRQGVNAAPGLGLLQMEVPAGNHEIRLSLAPTPWEARAEWASLGAAALALALLATAAWRGRGALGQRWRAVALALLLSVVLLAALAAAIGLAGAGTGSGPLVMDWVRAPYLHRLRGGVRFGPATLQDCALDRESVAPGEGLTLSVQWADLPADATLELELVALTAHLYPDTVVWAGVAAQGDLSTVTCPIPLDTPPGLYVLRPTLRTAGVALPAATAQGVPLGLLALQPIRVEDVAASGPVPAVLGPYGPSGSEPEITLRGAWAYAVGEHVCQVDMLWQSERQATRNYQLSVRLTDAEGNVLVSRDLPPLAGNYPTSLWIPGHRYSDSLVLRLPEGVDPARVSDAEIVLYDLQTLAAIGSVAVPLE
ncbi:MAG: 6-pyruvoyl-tetrahydropterin synthase-related protein [Anaerolineae bacterium]|nr:hypothetical protein [Chloroflexota bacterium]